MTRPIPHRAPVQPAYAPGLASPERGLAARAVRRAVTSRATPCRFAGPVHPDHDPDLLPLRVLRRRTSAAAAGSSGRSASAAAGRKVRTSANAQPNTVPASRSAPGRSGPGPRCPRNHPARPRSARPAGTPSARPRSPSSAASSGSAAAVTSVSTRANSRGGWSQPSCADVAVQLEQGRDQRVGLTVQAPSHRPGSSTRHPQRGNRRSRLEIFSASMRVAPACHLDQVRSVFTPARSAQFGGRHQEDRRPRPSRRRRSSPGSRRSAPTSPSGVIVPVPATCRPASSAPVGDLVVDGQREDQPGAGPADPLTEVEGDLRLRSGSPCRG